MKVQKKKMRPAEPHPRVLPAWRGYFRIVTVLASGALPVML